MLIATLQKFKDGVQNELVDFPIKGLDLGDIVSQKKVSNKYNLVAVINHYGKTLKGGHYTAHCYVESLGCWLTFNDEKVEQIPDRDVPSTVVTKNAYMLIYRRVGFKAISK